MKSHHPLVGWLALLALLSTLNYPLSTSYAQGTAFTYQGRLDSGGSPASGIYDLRFAIYDAGTAGNLVAGPVTDAATAVSNGLFTVTLDFGAGVFTGPRPLAGHRRAHQRRRQLHPAHAAADHSRPRLMPSPPRIWMGRFPPPN